MRKHQPYDLAQMQSLPLKSKINMSNQRIKDWYNHYDGNVYVSISGGKDSQVLATLVKRLYPDVPLIFVNTGLEYNSVRKKGIELADKVLVPDMSFVDVIKKYGYPIFSKEIAKSLDEAKRYFKILTEQNRTEQNRTEQNRTEQNRDSICLSYSRLYGDRQKDKQRESLISAIKEGHYP